GLSERPAWMCWHFRRVRVRTDGKTFGGPPTPPRIICDASIWPSMSGSVSLPTGSEDFPTSGFLGRRATAAITDLRVWLSGPRGAADGSAWPPGGGDHLELSSQTALA